MEVVRLIVDTYFAPNKTFPELRQLIDSDAMDLLRAFSDECRAELQTPNFSIVAPPKEAARPGARQNYNRCK